MNIFKIHSENKQLKERVRQLEDELMRERAHIVGLETVVKLKDRALGESLRWVEQLKELVGGLRDQGAVLAEIAKTITAGRRLAAEIQRKL